MYRALNVARYIVQRCNNQNRAISNLKLQKILYFVQAEFLVTKNQPCFVESIEAWEFGPVVPEVYHQYKIYGGANIPFRRQFSGVVSISEEDRELIDGIVDECMQYSASALVEITHNQKPWSNVYISGMNREISIESIRKYFSEV